MLRENPLVAEGLTLAAAADVLRHDVELPVRLRRDRLLRRADHLPGARHPAGRRRSAPTSSSGSSRSSSSTSCCSSSSPSGGRPGADSSTASRCSRSGSGRSPRRSGTSSSAAARLRGHPEDQAGGTGAPWDLVKPQLVGDGLLVARRSSSADPDRRRPGRPARHRRSTSSGPSSTSSSSPSSSRPPATAGFEPGDRGPVRRAPVGARPRRRRSIMIEFDVSTTPDGHRRRRPPRDGSTWSSARR